MLGLRYRFVDCEAAHLGKIRQVCGSHLTVLAAFRQHFAHSDVPGPGFSIWVLGFGVWGFEGLGIGVWVLGFMVYGLWFRV